MVRKTLVFGNGLGMALSPKHFSLDSAIGEVWENAMYLDEPSKKLIRDCLPVEGSERPRGEEDLDVLQLVLSACELLSRIGRSRIHWLSEQGLVFPLAVRKFIQQVALHFHRCGLGLPETFIKPLAAFLTETKSHVAMLNYDNLLYQPLIREEILSGYEGALVDGFWESGFAAENLDRRWGKTFGYYLHLHGSPLFVDQPNKIIKLSQSNAERAIEGVSSHIVLTHFKHKPTVISASEVLSAYWQKLEKALFESEEIIIIGYAGADVHLNAVLQQADKIPIRVVEWDGAGSEQNRQSFWKKLLSCDVRLVQMKTILDFDDWSGVK